MAKNTKNKKKILFNEEDRKYIYYNLSFRNFLKGSKKYTKKEKQKYQEKLKIQKRKQEKKEENKVVNF